MSTQQTSLCPENSEQTAEAYVLGQLSPAEMASFDNHIEGCELCGEALVETIEFIEAFQSAVKDDESQTSPRFRSRTR